MAVVQLNKTRLVTNLSTPKNRSLNDVLKAGEIPKNFMMTARIGAYMVLKIFD
jgi:hypothetical protein